MPPPSPYNLNRWFVVGAIVLVGAGYMATRKSKPPFEFERVSETADAAADATDAAHE